MLEIMLKPLRKYAVFSGRARRREYWSFWLFLLVINMLLVSWLMLTIAAVVNSRRAVIVDGPDFYDYIEATAISGATTLLPLAIFGLFNLVMFLPSLAVGVRRLHDANFSGWWIWIGLLPAGGLVLLVFFLLDGTSGPNRFGPDPKDRPAPILPG